MTPRLVVGALAVVLGAWVGASGVRGQTPAHRPPPQGAVTGLEMTLEGPSTVVRGGTARFFVTLHQVLHERDLAPAPRAQVRVSGSYDPAHPVAVVTTDAAGRALVAFDVPATLEESSIALTFDARSGGAGRQLGIRRRFDIGLEVTPRLRIELFGVGDVATPTNRVRVFGRVMDDAIGLPRAGATVHVGAEPWFGAARDVTSGASGLFVASLPGHGGNPGAIHATIDDELAVPQAAVSFHAPPDDVGPFLVRVVPSRWVVRDTDVVDFDLDARALDGRPLAGATVHRDGDPPFDEHHPRTETDAHGHFHVQLRPGDGAPAGKTADVPLRWTVTAPGLGEQAGRVVVRVARVPWIVTVAAEGGALAAALPSRLYVRVVAPDGSPAPAGKQVTVTAPRLGNMQGTTDAAGIVRLDVTLAEAGALPADDACGGPTALATDVTIDGATETRCVAVDPDASLRVRLAQPMVTPGGTLVATVTRGRAVARMPIVVAALAIVGGDASGVLAPVARAEIAPGANDAHLTLPPGLRGLVLVRARPVVASDGEEARGGTALAWVRAEAPTTTLAVNGDHAHVASGGAPAGETREALIAAMPYDAATALEAALRGVDGAFVGELRGASGLLGEALLASVAPEDRSAPAVLRDGHLVALPASDDPTHDAMLRDPFRARARFVSGRIALVVRALEHHVEAHLPDGLDDVSAVSPHGRVLSRELIDAVVGESDTGAEGPRGLGGAPLTMDSLVAIDPQIDFDHVARRLTRARLFRVLVALRGLVQRRGLDLRWAWRGEPDALLRLLTSEADDETGEMLTREQLFDAWGHPFVLRPHAAAAHAAGETVVLDPLPGWQLVSPGPDGRAGTGDDVTDPFVRVVASGSPYAIAVGEDDLLARAHDVALGRARIEALQPLFGDDEPPAYEEPDGTATHDDFDDVPAPLDVRTPPLFVRPGSARPYGTGRLSLAEGGADATLATDPEGRPLAAVAVVASSSGAVGVARAELASTATLLLDATLPARLRVGEPLVVPVRLTALAGSGPRVLHVDVTGARATLSAPQVTLAAGATGELDLTLTAERPGAVRIVLTADGAQPRTARATADDGGVLREQVAGALVARDHTLEVELPADASSANVELVVTDPAHLTHDPAADGLRTVSPALIAWADTLAGRAPDDESRVALLAMRDGAHAVNGRLPALDTACALVAWSAAPESDSAAAAARLQAAGALSAAGGAIDGDDDGTRIDAAVLAALAAGASGAPTNAEDAVDPVAADVAAMRESLRDAIGVHGGEPGVLARAAAALLLADVGDAAGRSMLARAAAATQTGPHGGRLLFDADGAIDVAGTAALAIAALQADDAATTGDAARGLAGFVARGLAGDEETAFWTLAAGAYGALGTGAVAHVVATIDGTRRDLALTDGVSRTPLAHATRVAVAGGASPVLARIVARYTRPATQRNEAPLRLSIDGDVGRLGELAGLELTVENASDRTIAVPIVEVSLPAAALLEASALSTAPHVVGLGPPDARGMVRIQLRPLAAHEHVTLPLAMRWVARGATRGLAVSAYEMGVPTRLTMLPARTVNIGR